MYVLFHSGQEDVGYLSPNYNERTAVRVVGPTLSDLTNSKLAKMASTPSKQQQQNPGNDFILSMKEPNKEKNY